ncbi:LuxR C-terminal-related transcriptional regulator [Chloroflexota bacterium]
MNTKNIVLTREERDVLVLGGIRINGKQLSNTEIAQRLGMSVNKVKTLIHQSCTKLGAHGRNEVILFALMRGEISLNQIYTLDEIAERFSSVGPDMLRRIAQLVSQGLDHGYLIEKDGTITYPDRRQDTLLTQAERDVLILAGCGLPNKEIADKLCISISAVRTFLYRSCTKLGACRRADVVILAVKQREISVLDIFSPDNLMQILAPLGAEYIEQIAQLVDQRLRRDAVPIGS